MEHHWASFAFQVSDQLSQESSQPQRQFGEFVLIQLGVTSPSLLAGLLLDPGDSRVLKHEGPADQLEILFCFLSSTAGLPVVLHYSLSVKANWTLLGFCLSLSSLIPATAIFVSTAEPE